MVIEKPEHQQFLLEAIKNIQIPGHLLDRAHEVKEAVQNAQIAD